MDTGNYRILKTGIIKDGIIQRLIGNYALEEKFLMLAAMTDTKLAVKENEALLTLAKTGIIKDGIIQRYFYIIISPVYISFMIQINCQCQ